MRRISKAAWPHLVAAVAGILAGDARAHMFGTVYTLPIPFWMYAYGATAALVASFVLVAYTVNATHAGRPSRGADLGRFRLARLVTHPALIAVLRVVSVACLLGTTAAALFGSANPFTNVSVTFFWIVFLLGLMYLTAIVGDVYAAINPWRALADAIERVAPGTFRARRAYPSWLGVYPAFVFYCLLITMELFAGPNPRFLGSALLAYTVLNLLAASQFGRDAWFRSGELFAVFFRLVGKMAPLDCGERKNAGDRCALRIRTPFIGLVDEPASHWSVLLFVLFMLSSTAFDGAHQTVPWVSIFWKGLYPAIDPILRMFTAQPLLVAPNVYYVWQWIMLILSPFLYLAIYLVFIGLAKMITGTELTVRQLALRFAYTLIPIAFVYNVSHYYTLLVTQSPNILPLLSDPFWRGWNLLGTRGLQLDPVILDAGTVWHTQVWLILFGHIVSVYLAHVEALRVFPTNRKAALSQLPMLVLMVIFTTAGLWILSLPIEGGQVVQPPAGGGGG